MWIIDWCIRIMQFAFLICVGLSWILTGVLIVSQLKDKLQSFSNKKHSII